MKDMKDDQLKINYDQLWNQQLMMCLLLGSLPSWATLFGMVGGHAQEMFLR